MELVTPETTLIEKTIAESYVEDPPEAIDYTKIDERVLKGVRFLDSEVPDWATRINLQRFQMSHGEYCVLGQLYGGYGEGLERIHGNEYGQEDWASERGFWDANCDYNRLQQDWVKVIAERQRTAG